MQKEKKFDETRFSAEVVREVVAACVEPRKSTG